MSHVHFTSRGAKDSKNCLENQVNTFLLTLVWNYAIVDMPSLICHAPIDEEFESFQFLWLIENQQILMQQGSPTPIYGTSISCHAYLASISWLISIINVRKC
jgi:hypothetical protein